MDMSKELDKQLTALFNNYVKYLDNIFDREVIEDTDLNKPKTLKKQFLETIQERLFSKELDKGLLAL